MHSPHVSVFDGLGDWKLTTQLNPEVTTVVDYSEGLSGDGLQFIHLTRWAVRRVPYLACPRHMGLPHGQRAFSLRTGQFAFDEFGCHQLLP